MARTSKQYDLKSPTARKDDKNTPVRDRFYACNAGARRLGYIRRAERNGTWLAIESIPGTKREKMVVLGQANDYTGADGVKVLTYEQAMKKAAGAAELVSAAGALTVEKAVRDYYDIKSGKDDNAEKYRGQLNKHMTEELNRTRVDKLTTTQLTRWFTDLTRAPDPKDPDPKKAKRKKAMKMSSANRVLGQLKAALNFAFMDVANNLPSSAAWDKVDAHRGTDNPRTQDLDYDQVRRLIEAAASFDQALANLIQAAFLTGARAPGELRMLDRKDFDASAKTLHVRFGKVAKKKGPRYVSLNKESVAFFTRMAKDKLPEAPLLPGLDGLRWPVEGHDDDVDRAVKLAGLPSGKGGVTIYTLRHAHISRAIQAGANLKVIADNCGTSLLMIQRFYAKVLASARQRDVDDNFPKLYTAA